jgi:hypothetical protein
MHELSDKELHEKLSSGELSEKKATIARAILRRRHQERLQAWFKRHGWLARGVRSGQRFFYSALRFR